MITDKIKELEAAKAKVASLTEAISAERNKELASLPSQYGFATTADFINAVRAATAGKRGRPVGGGKKRTRAVITDAIRAEVKKMAAAGKTGNEIAAAVGISLPSVQNIKKALGLIRKRGK